jgi:hypothetical protein
LFGKREGGRESRAGRQAGLQAGIFKVRIGLGVIGRWRGEPEIKRNRERHRNNINTEADLTTKIPSKAR